MNRPVAGLIFSNPYQTRTKNSKESEVMREEFLYFLCFSMIGTYEVFRLDFSLPPGIDTYILNKEYSLKYNEWRISNLYFQPLAAFTVITVKNRAKFPQFLKSPVGGEIGMKYHFFCARHVPKTKLHREVMYFFVPGSALGDFT